MWYRAGYFIGTTGGCGTVFYSYDVVCHKTGRFDSCTFTYFVLFGKTSLWFVRIGVFFKKITEFTNLWKSGLLFINVITSQSRAAVARQAHYLEVTGSIPVSATIKQRNKSKYGNRYYEAC